MEINVCKEYVLNTFQTTDSISLNEVEFENVLVTATTQIDLLILECNYQKLIIPTFSNSFTF